MKLFYLMLSVIFFVGCKNDKPKTENEAPVEKTEKNLKSTAEQTAFGIYTFTNVNDINEAYAKLKGIFDKNSSVGVVAELDHAKNAKSVGLELNPTRAIFFGNPNLGTPLMQVNPLTGLDLPQKIVFMQIGNENKILYNDMEYLNQRYALDGHKNLGVISNTLKTLVSKSSGSTTVEHKVFEVSKHQGIITKKSNHNYKTTLDKLLTLLQNHKALKVIAKLDHQANAKKAGLELTPSYLVVFGNPKMGSPLMQSQQSLALDLPQKMLVWENAEGEVFVSYNDIYFLQKRHQIEGHKKILKKISGALDKISSSVIE